MESFLDRARILDVVQEALQSRAQMSGEATSSYQIRCGVPIGFVSAWYDKNHARRYTFSVPENIQSSVIGRLASMRNVHSIASFIVSNSSTRSSSNRPTL